MWNDVIVGGGDKGSSACNVFEIEGYHSISENRTSYWVSEVYIGLGMTVFKNTEEGARLAQMIKDKDGLEKISAFLIDVLLRNIDREKLKSAIDNAISCAFDDGCNAKAAEVRRVIGI